jgi:hypothetical protein
MLEVVFLSKIIYAYRDELIRPKSAGAADNTAVVRTWALSQP